MGIVHRYVVNPRQCCSVLQVNRNLTDHHIMMEGSALFPGGFHPSRQDRSPDCKSKAFPIRRVDAQVPVRYYFIDFSQAVQVQSTAFRSISGHKKGPDGTLDQITGESYKSFQVDIYALGQLYRSAFINACTIPWVNVSSQAHIGSCFHTEIHQCRLLDVPGRRNDYRHGIRSTVSSCYNTDIPRHHM